MNTGWQIALVLGILSLVMGIVEHFLMVGGSGGVFRSIASPDAFMGFAMAMFLLALVFQVGVVLGAMEEKVAGEE